MKFLSFLLWGLLAVSLGVFAAINLDQPDNYSNQPRPPFVGVDNTPAVNPINDRGATLGRVLFYDKKLSANNTIACASCHKQEFAFSDTATRSIGLDGGLTGRHSMRLINARFAAESRFFWDERASFLEMQSTMPIKDHIEMGFSGTEGQPNFDSLISKMNTIEYYKSLFIWAFGDSVITETRVQQALSQFVRSIQSFDSKFDAGMAQVGNNINAPFPNFTAEENRGKQIFIDPPPLGGAGCQGCHRAPVFDIDPNSRNNGVIGVAGSTTAIDLTNTRAPSLRDLVNPQGRLNGPMMHNGAFTTIDQVIEHYSNVPLDPRNTNLDQRLRAPGRRLNLSTADKAALKVFLLTLTGRDVYTNPKWSNPFEPDGRLLLVPSVTLPSQIVLLAPTDERRRVQNPVDFTWQPDQRATFYHLQIMTADSAIVFSDSLLTMPTFEWQTAAQGTTYLWRVRGGNTTGYGVWSAIRSFSVQAAPVTVSLVLPQNAALVPSESVFFSWASDIAQRYHIRIRQQNTTTFIVNDSTLRRNDVTITDLRPQTTYFWSVRARNSDNDWGPWSEERMFATNNPTSVEEGSGILSARIFPNPAHHTATLELPPLLQSCKIQIIGLGGNIVYSHTLPPNGGQTAHKFSVANLAAGRYIIHWQSGNYQGQKILIVQK